ncbi:MAG: protein phosphatase CheZ [Roseibium sp.]
MKAEAIQEDPESLGEVEYKTLEQTLMESDRGRRFLREFLNRNKTPETTEILGAIQRLEKVVTKQRKVPDLDKIRLDIADMHEAIERTKSEIANIKDDGEQSNRFVDASHELDAIVTQTEGATQSILEAAEQIQEKAWVLRENGAEDATCDDIDAKATEIFMACSFQDLTGQRTNKVVQVLRYLESRINTMINIWGIEDRGAEDDAGPVDSRPDAHLLNGPQHVGAGVSQSNVDELFSGNDDVFDTVPQETAAAAPVEAPAAPVHASENDVDAIMAGGGEAMDAAAIDDMFAAEPVEDDTPAEPEIVEAAEDEFASAAAEEELDEAAIEALFDNEISEETPEEPVSDVAAETEVNAEAGSEVETEADADWKLTEAAAEEEADDPLQQLSEAERQALFN